MSDRGKIFTIGATTHVECLNDNYDVIGYVVWQPYCKNGKTLDLCISETAPRKNLKLGTSQVPSWGMSDFFNDIVTVVEIHRTPFRFPRDQLRR